MATKTPAGRRWTLRGPAPDGAVPPLGLPPIAAQLFHNRGLATGPEIEAFLNPAGSLPHDPSRLPGLDLAAHRLIRAVNAGETIGIFGDFDVDGVTGTAVVARGLIDLGVRVVPYIPHRMDEGHGLNVESVQVLREQGVSVLITVDCGVTSLEEVALANDLGMDVIITDHHVAPPRLPPALSIIDPKLEGSDYPFEDLSGAGLAFKLVEGLYGYLGQPWKRDLLELVALSTVADLVPLRDENRYLVKEGLKELRRTHRPGLVSLYQHAGIAADSVDVEAISYVIAPRLNAAGRLDHASVSYQLLMTDSRQEADSLASRLEALNRERQRMTAQAWAIAEEEVASWKAIPPILIVGDSRFSPGISGLVAGKLVNEFNRPAVAMSIGDDLIRASARSIPDFDMADALAQCRDLFIRHGGHTQAAGFVMSPGNLPSLKKRLGQVAEEKLGQREFQPTLDIDAEVSVASLIGETYRWITELAPFGVGNPQPVFMTRSIRPIEARTVGADGRHLRLKLKEGRVVWDAMAFGQGDRWIADTPMLDVVYTIGTDRRRGTDVLALKVLDFRPSI